MKYLVSSTVATLCVFGATGAYYISDEHSEEVEQPQITQEVEAQITQKMQNTENPRIFLPYMECDLDPGEDLTDDKIESHIANCMKNTHSWQPVESYPN